jgi:hypothetical protein
MVSAKPIFAQPTITRYIFVQGHCTEFYTNRAKNVENTAKISFTSLSKALTSPIKTIPPPILAQRQYMIFLHQISPKSVNKNGKQSSHSITHLSQARPLLSPYSRNSRFLYQISVQSVTPGLKERLIMSSKGLQTFRITEDTNFAQSST